MMIFFSKYLKTALHTASWNNKKEAVGALISHGADINARMKDGITPLMDASMRGHAQIVGVLLAAGADKEMRNNTGETALDIARRCERWKVAEMLVDDAV
jgi:ankyrin repeat protein